MRRFYELIRNNIFKDNIYSFFKKNSSDQRLPLITISREMGSGGRPIADIVAKKLGRPWKIYHKNIVEKIAKQTNLEKQLIKEVDEKKIPLIEDTIADVFGKRYLNLTTYHKGLVKILSTIGLRGHAIIIGRGAHYLFPDALNIRIICEMPQRIAWEMQYERISRNEAIRRIEQSDKSRYEFEKALFGHDIRKAQHYDLVIRTGQNLSIHDAADLIIRIAKRRFGKIV